MAGETRGVKLHIENVVKEYKGEHGTTIALNGVNLDIMENEFVCVVGPSGCGKTTLLNMILGIVDADQGVIRYNGEDLTRTPMGKRGFNIVFQDYALFPHFNVQQNIT